MRYGKTLLNYCIEFKAVITQTVILQAYMTLFPLKYLNSSERLPKYAMATLLSCFSQLFKVREQKFHMSES